MAFDDISRNRNYRVKQYKTMGYKGCKVRSECTPAKGQRIIERNEYAQALQRNKYESSLRTGNLHKKSCFEGDFHFLRLSDALVSVH